MCGNIITPTNVAVLCGKGDLNPVLFNQVMN
jgi:hypothetical protein